VGWYDWIWYDWCVWVWYQRYISKMWLIFTKRNVIPWFPGSSIRVDLPMKHGWMFQFVM
jgi:hypothetical protein